MVSRARASVVWIAASLLVLGNSCARSPQLGPPRQGDQALNAGPANTCDPAFYADDLPYPGTAPGDSVAKQNGADFSLENMAIAASWTIDGGSLAASTLVNRLTGETLATKGEVFELELVSGTSIKSSNMKVRASPTKSAIAPDCRSTRTGDHYAGQEWFVSLESDRPKLTAEWRVTLRNGSNYVRQSVTFKNGPEALAVRNVVLYRFRANAGITVGKVKGSPLVVGDAFLGCEHPMAENAIVDRAVEIGGWSPSEVSYPKHRIATWNASAAVALGKGAYKVRFQYTSGAHRLDVFRVSLKANGVIVAEDVHEGRTGLKDVLNTYSLDLATYDPAATYSLEADLRSDGGTDSNGLVQMSLVSSGTFATGSLRRNGGFDPNEELTQSSVFGTLPPGQRRRGFLYYLERERAHPHRPFLHYNS